MHKCLLTMRRQTLSAQNNANNENETSSNALLNFGEFETATGLLLMPVVHLWFNPNYFREISLHYEDQVAKFK